MTKIKSVNDMEKKKKEELEKEIVTEMCERFNHHCLATPEEPCFCKCHLNN